MSPAQPLKKLWLFCLAAALLGAALLLSSRTKAAAADLALDNFVYMPFIAKPLPDYLIMSRSQLKNLSTITPTWAAVVVAATSDPGLPDLCDQDNRTHPKVTFASALVYARTGDPAYEERTRSLIFSAIPTQVDGCNNAVLALGRQLGAYVIAADLIELKDAGYNNWLTSIRNRNIGGNSRWYSLRETALDTANNWGVFALASLIAADRYLKDNAALAQDWQVFSSYGAPFGWPFNKTTVYNDAWSCFTSDGSDTLPIAINPPCFKDGYNLDGAPVEDASRSTFPSVGQYPTESAQALVVQALLLDMAGYPAWTVNESQIRRLAEFRGRFNNLNFTSTDYYVTWITNKVYGLNQPTKPASYGRIFGFTDWLFPP